jgi:hypothetical protein
MNKIRSFVCTALLVSSGIANAHTVFFDPSNATATVGNTFTLDIKGKNFFNQTDRGGVNFTFNPAIVQVAGVTVPNGTWETATAPATIDNSAGSVTGLNVASATGHGPTFSLAEVLFKAVGSGNTGLSLSENGSNRFMRAGTSSPIPGFSVGNGTVSVSAAPVPLPGAFWLLGSALVTMLLGRRKSQDYVAA